MPRSPPKRCPTHLHHTGPSVALVRFRRLQEAATRTLLANIQAKVVKVSPCTNVEIDDGVVSLGNLAGDLKNKDTQKEIRDSIMQTRSVKDVVFEQKSKIRRVHVNPFYNLDCY